MTLCCILRSLYWIWLYSLVKASANLLFRKTNKHYLKEHLHSYTHRPHFCAYCTVSFLCQQKLLPNLHCFCEANGARSWHILFLFGNSVSSAYLFSAISINSMLRDLIGFDVWNNQNPTFMNWSLLLEHYLPFKPQLYTPHKCFVRIYLVLSEI